MAIVFTMTMPKDVSLSMVDEVSVEMGVEKNPPAGLIVHTHFEVDGHVKVVDVWDSAEAHSTFEQERLGPALAAVAQRRGIDPMQGEQPDTASYEVHMLVRGA